MDRIVFVENEKEENPHHYVEKKHKSAKISTTNTPFRIAQVVNAQKKPVPPPEGGYSMRIVFDKHINVPK